MGIAPVFAIPRLLSRHGLTVDDIDLWELNEAYACQVLYIVNRLGLPLERLNVNGGAISIGHPFGMTGARQVGHVLLEGRRRSEEHTSELQSLMRISYAVFCLKTQNHTKHNK